MALASNIPTESSHQLGDRYDHVEIEPRIRELWDDANIYRWNPDDTSRP